MLKMIDQTIPTADGYSKIFSLTYPCTKPINSSTDFYIYISFKLIWVLGGFMARVSFSLFWLEPILFLWLTIKPKNCRMIHRRDFASLVFLKFLLLINAYYCLTRNFRLSRLYATNSIRPLAYFPLTVLAQKFHSTVVDLLQKVLEIRSFCSSLIIQSSLLFTWESNIFPRLRAWLCTRTTLIDLCFPPSAVAFILALQSVWMTA